MTTTPVGADLLVERFGARADIVLNRPERRNAVTRSLASQLKAAIVEAANDVEVRAIVLRGAGGCFCSGMDLKAAGDDLADEPRDTWTQVHAAIYECQTPIVVALERFAINAGAALVLAADLTVAGEGAFLQVSEIAMGVAAPMNQAWLHLRHSPVVAGRVTLIGDRLPAAELLRLGLVTEVVADDQVVVRAQALADRIASHPLRGLAGIVSVAKRLSPPIADPYAYFASLMGTV